MLNPVLIWLSSFWFDAFLFRGAFFQPRPSRGESRHCMYSPPWTGPQCTIKVISSGALDEPDLAQTV